MRVSVEPRPAAAQRSTARTRRLPALRRPGRARAARATPTGSPTGARAASDERHVRAIRAGRWGRSPPSCSPACRCSRSSRETSSSGSPRSRSRASFPKGVRVFHEGDDSDACYIVRDGDLRVTREHSDGRAIALATLGPGDIFGELAMLDGGTRSASVETLTDSELLGAPGHRRPPGDRRPRRHRREADRRDHPAPARDQRAGRAAVVPDGAEPGRGGALPADRRGGDPRGAAEGSPCG